MLEAVERKEAAASDVATGSTIEELEAMPDGGRRYELIGGRP